MAKQTFTVGQILTSAQMTSLQATAMGGGAATAKTASYVLVAADAGTTVAMNAAGATTITVNVALFAAGDTVFIQNLGAGACTVTAGTATVSTAGSLILPQYDAGILYFTSASTAIFYDYIQVGAASPLTTKGDLYTYGTSDTRLGVGANGTTLVADSSEATGLKWATPAAGGGMTLLSTTSLTGTSVTVSSISQSYKNLFVEVFGCTWDTSNDAWTFATNLGAVNSSKKVNSTSITSPQTNATTINQINDGSDNILRTGGNNYVTYNFTNYASTSTYKTCAIYGSFQDSGSGGTPIVLFVSINSNTAINEFTFKIAGSQNMTAGTIKIYGVN